HRLEKIVANVNNIYGKAGVSHLHLEYPLHDVGKTRWELQVSGQSRSGELYVMVKPGDRPISSTTFGTHSTFDRGDTKEVDRHQEKAAAKALRDMTDQAQRGLADKAEKADHQKQAISAGDREELRRMQEEQAQRIRDYQNR